MLRTKRAYWRNLDNAAKLFSAASNKKDTRVFRFYCELKEEVDRDNLQLALNRTIEKYPIFLSVMRRGIFWHYLEKSELRPAVREEYKEPCSTLYVRDKKSLLFEVTYYKKRINFEVFHALTDGTGATEFLKELVKQYLKIAHKEEELPDTPLLDERITVSDQEDDSFLKYYFKGEKKEKKKKPKAFQIRRPKKEIGRLRITEGVVSVKDLQEKSREYGVSMTVLLTTVFLCAIHKEMKKLQERKPVILMVPVNLRKFFSSASMLNFFGWIEPGYQFGEGKDEFSDVLSHVKQFFKDELTTEKMAAHINYHTSLERHPILKFTPLGLKNLCISVGAKVAESNVTAIFSNMSIVAMPKEYVPYIERFGVYTSTPKVELCMCSFEDKASLSFTSRYDSTNIQRNFFEILNKIGIKTEFPETEYPEEKRERFVGMQFLQWFSFVSIAAAVISVSVNLILTPGRYWSLLVGGGLISTWLALAVGFYKRHNLLKNTMWQLLVVTGGSVIWDVLTTWRGWSVNYVLPVACVLSILSMLVITRIQSHSAREYMAYIVMAAGYGLLVPLILMLTKVVTVTFPSIITVGFSILVLSALVIFRSREFKEEMHKKFHV